MTTRPMRRAAGVALLLALAACGGGSSSSTAETTNNATEATTTGSATTSAHQGAGDLQAWCAGYRAESDGDGPAARATGAKAADAAAPPDIIDATHTWSAYLNGDTSIDAQKYSDATTAVMQYFGAHC